MLNIEHVSRTYPNGVHALSDVNLTIGAGEIVAIVGGSGCGKSTLLRLIAGLDDSTSGAIKVDDIHIAAPHPDVGIIFQEPRLLPWLNIADNISFYISDLPKAQRQVRVEQVLDRIGLLDYAHRWPRELSGGQAQRVAIARSLVAQPKVLLLDEPFSALDAFTRISLQDALLDLWQSQRPTLVIVTHDVQEAVALSNRVIVMQPHPGRVHADLTFGLQYPRDRLSSEFIQAERDVMRTLGQLAAPTSDHAKAVRAVTT